MVDLQRIIEESRQAKIRTSITLFPYTHSFPSDPSVVENRDSLTSPERRWLTEAVVLDSSCNNNDASSTKNWE
ncbi:unnamed protein product [Linum trigynum]|uniref:Uncharacterized protein n=1 Tax=Linum trigynum TaxID=586398 RepID=A0AAV2FQ30_9ROSI